MNILSYKGYTAKISFDERDMIFIGRILGIREIISFHAETTRDLVQEFENSVDDFITDCTERGVTPTPPSSGKLMLRIPPEIHRAALISAHTSGKSLNQWAI